MGAAHLWSTKKAGRCHRTVAASSEKHERNGPQRLLFPSPPLPQAPEPAGAREEAEASADVKALFSLLLAPWPELAGAFAPGRTVGGNNEAKMLPFNGSSSPSSPTLEPLPQSSESSTFALPFEAPGPASATLLEFETSNVPSLPRAQTATEARDNTCRTNWTWSTNANLPGRLDPRPKMPKTSASRKPFLTKWEPMCRAQLLLEPELPQGR